MANFTKCDLHIPYKDWAGDQKELNNYLELERWARQLLHGGCIQGSTTATQYLLWSCDGNQLVPSGSWTLMDPLFISVNHLPGASVATSQITLTQAGDYDISLWVEPDAGGGLKVDMNLIFDGTSPHRIGVTGGTSSSGLENRIYWNVATSDYLEVQLRQNSGANQVFASKGIIVYLGA